MIINVHAGHAAVGKGASGASGIINESVEDRKVKNVVIKYLQAAGHTVHDCTVDSGTQSQVLSGIVKKCNAHIADLDVSIHFNAGANRPYSDGITTGVEVLVYSATSESKDEAERICNRISALGYKNRGVKVRKDLYVLKKTKAPALLVECCFVDDGDDCKIYDPEKMGKAIVEGILGTSVAAPTIVQTAAAPVTGTSCYMKAKITATGLRIRKGPGTTYKTNGYVDKGVIYTIVEKNGSWGKLKSGAGWICISTKYVKFV